MGENTTLGTLLTDRFWLMFICLLFRESAIYLSNNGTLTAFASRRNWNYQLEFQNMFSFPEYYQGTKEGVGIPAQYLEEVAQLSGTMDADIENRGFIEEGLRQNCESFLPNPAEISAKDAIEGYQFLKFKLSNN